MIKKRSIFIAILCLTSFFCQAQQDGNSQYWITFDSKKGTPYNLQKPEEFLSQRAIERRQRQDIRIDSTDLPVNPNYIKELSKLGFRIMHTSKWMNGAMISKIGTTSVEDIETPSFVTSVELIKPADLTKSATYKQKFELTDSLFYGNSYTQNHMLGIEELHKYSRGKNVHVAILDGGFYEVDEADAFDSLRARNGILGTFDVVSPENNVYKEDYHGCAIISLMAANSPGQMVGTAPDASYWLVRTEDINSEYPIEMYNWIIGAEFADSVGCDVINTSLGYSIFDDSNMNINYEQVKAGSSEITKAANMAVNKGIVVVVSAGNDRNKALKYIAVPANASNAITVAAVDEYGDISSFSSAGFSEEQAPRKPDVSAMGVHNAILTGKGNLEHGSGTSFAAPLVAGFAACVVSLFPDKKASEIIDMIRQSCNNYPQHDTLYGYGIPNVQKILDKYSASTEINISDTKIYPNPFSNHFNIECTENEAFTFSIFNINGEKVYSRQFSNDHNTSNLVIEAQNWPQGIYFAEIRNQQGRKTTKLIKL